MSSAVSHRPSSSKGHLRHRAFAAAAAAKAGIRKTGIRRLAMRAGIKRLGDAVCTDAVIVLRSFMGNIIRDAIAHTELAGRKTVSSRDVIAAVNRTNRRLYGFK